MSQNNELYTSKEVKLSQQIDSHLTPSNSAQLVPSENVGRIDASYQAGGVRDFKCTSRGEREGEGERNS